MLLMIMIMMVILFEAQVLRRNQGLRVRELQRKLRRLRAPRM